LLRNVTTENDRAWCNDDAEVPEHASFTVSQAA
jgi:hypothetical protein